MKIGFFTDSYFPTIDGVTYTLRLWRNRLEQAGHEVWIVYPDGDYQPAAREIPIKSLPNPFYPGYRLGLAKRASKLPEFDIVHSHGPAMGALFGLYYARKNDVPSVYTHHTPIEEYFHQSIRSRRVAGLLKKLYVPVENNILERFDTVTTSTDRMSRDVPSVKLPVGVDLEFFRPREGSSADDQTLIGYSGRISMEKNVAEILRVAERLSGCDFVVVGEGPRRPALERNAPDNVVFRDFLPRKQLPGFYSALDTFVTASTADTLGLSTLEANACGTPVAAADVPPFTETIGSQNGTRFQYGDLDSMAAAIDSCLDGSHSTRRGVEQYSADRTIHNLETIYGELRSSGVSSNERLRATIEQNVPQ
jgi:1,2-diacylglycerol 3-alpha-glucosyltransferase